MVVEVGDGDDDEDTGEEVRPVSPETALIEARMRSIQDQIKLVGGYNRVFAGMYNGKVQGIMIGLSFTLVVGFLLML